VPANTPKYLFFSHFFAGFCRSCSEK